MPAAIGYTDTRTGDVAFAVRGKDTLRGIYMRLLRRSRPGSRAERKRGREGRAQTRPLHSGAQDGA